MWTFSGINVSDYDNLVLSFWLYYDTEYEHDDFRVYLSPDSILYDLRGIYTGSSYWTYVEMPIYLITDKLYIEFDFFKRCVGSCSPKANVTRHISIHYRKEYQSHTSCVSILEQIVEFFFAVFFGVGLGGNTAGALHDIAHLEKITEIGFFLVGDIGLDRLLALKTAGGVEMATTPAAAQIRQTLNTGVGAGDLVFYAGRFPAVPTHQTFNGHERSFRLVYPKITKSVRRVKD